VRLAASDLARARIRAARHGDDVARAMQFIRTARAKEILDAHPEERGCVRLLEVDGEILAALLFDPRPIRLRGLPVPCARVVETGGEDGRPHFRSTGDPEAFDLLVEEFLGYPWARGYAFAYAHGELALFPAHGFVPCFYHPRASVAVAAALQLPSPYRVRHLKTDDARRIPSLRVEHEALKPVVIAAGVPRFHHFCIEGPDRRLLGYFSLEVDAASTWNPKVFVPELETLDRGAACTLLHHCAREAKTIGLEEIHFPVAAAHPVGALCLELGGRAVLFGASHDAMRAEEMLCAVARPRILEALAPAMRASLAGSGLPAEDRALVLRTERDAVPLRVRGGEVQAAPAASGEPAGEVSLPDWQLTQLLAGYRAVGETDAKGGGGDLELLDALLPKTWPLSLPDPDHFDPVLPPWSFAPAAVERARAVRLPWARG